MVVKNGLLLVPETVKWQDYKTGGAPARDVVALQKRACFTEISPRELPHHAQQFGPFALEMQIAEMRYLGVVPVFYVPQAPEYQGLMGIGGSLVARLADVQALLERLNQFLIFAEHSGEERLDARVLGALDASGNLVLFVEGETDPVTLTISEALFQEIKVDNPTFEPPAIPAGQADPLGCTVAGLRNLLRFLTYGIQTYEVQLGSIRAMGGLFYPTERSASDEPLAYYRQREWRIIAGMKKDGQVVDDTLGTQEEDDLIALDPEFFGRTLTVRSGACAMVKQCKVLRAVEGKAFFSYVHRVICPTTSIAEVRVVLESAGHGTVPVVPIESLNCK